MLSEKPELFTAHEFIQQRRDTVLEEKLEDIRHDCQKQNGAVVFLEAFAAFWGLGDCDIGCFPRMGKMVYNSGSGVKSEARVEQVND